MTKSCERVLPLKQYGPTCWFNALLTSILYSEQSRELLIKKSQNWNKKIKVLQTVKYILEHKFLKTSNVNNDYLYFDKVKPEYILGLLHRYNKKKFRITEKHKRGYMSVLYIRKLYKLFGASLLLLDLNNKNNTLYYSKYNNYSMSTRKGKDYITYISKPLLKIKDNYEKNKTPDVLIITQGPEHNITVGNLDMKVLMKQNDIDNIKTLKDNIELNKEEYILDSVILSNWNYEQSKLGHAISGITCNKERYIYNGWTRQTIDPALVNNNDKLDIPCELMKYNWDIHKSDDFCLNPRTCAPDKITNFMIEKMKVYVQNVCFSFNSGNKILIYIKKSKDPNLNINDDKCEKNKVRNPLTNRCKKINDINEKPKEDIVIKKECPKGKVLNPTTKRCINIPKKPKEDIVIKKECPKGKVLNPTTKRCINIPKKPKQDIIIKKECPKGKVLNPTTKRCINIPKKPNVKSILKTNKK